MKKYSRDYFEKKFKILFDKLIIKEDFVDEIKKTRKELGIPIENGFDEIPQLAEFLMKKLTAKEQHSLAFFCFIEKYEAKKGIRLNDGNREEVIDAFIKESKGKFKPLDIIIFLSSRIDDHNNYFTQNHFISENKKLSKLFPTAWSLFQKFFNVDLLDEHIMMHFIEKYLFLGEKGVHNYIQNKIACPNCRYIGVAHFSPDRYDMDGQEEGPFSGKYIFSERTVKLLSSHFNSVFIIVKPYATKEQVLSYVEDNWNDLKEHIIKKNTFYKQYDVKVSEIKESDVKRNQLIYELYKLPKKELLKHYKGEKNLSLAGVYKESIISAILDEQNDIQMTPDAIKKSAARFAKSIKNKREPKDIRDI